MQIKREGNHMKKTGRFFMAMVGILTGTTPVMAAEQPEVPTKVQKWF